ncbi:hypothetical protein F5Y08DRAFT_44690 [Xylaria arbuscula]|nr:hypothetical protein F5Y08DRAFT_44690 [Xylaria arbuscula]
MMPDEEMEMAVDFGQAGFGEDIDIDLDFPAGQPDEDMDLGDFDGIHDIQNFNSDTRDELMAEGDDASYGMVDAIDLEHNASAAVANDIDIELEQTVDSIWQQEPQHVVDIQPDTEIDYIDEPTVEDMDAQRNNIETSEWISTAPATQNTGLMDHADGLSAEIPTGPQETEAVDNPVPFEGTSLPAETLHTIIETTHSPSLSGERGNGELSEAIAPEDRIAGVDTEDFNQSLTADHNGVITSLPSGDAEIKTVSTPELHEFEEHIDAGHLDQVSEVGPDHIQSPLAPNDFGQLDHSEGSETGDAKKEQPDSAQPEEAYEPADGSEYQSGGASSHATTKDQTTADDTVPQTGSSAPDGLDSELVQVSSDQNVSGDENQESAIADVGGSVTKTDVRDDPFEIVDRYGVCISYGQTDYRLFASSDDDDPNQYFLTDKMVINLPLSRFLTSLREVISEEISPLDDLVMEIDGLGLEFSESTTPDFLDKFTFGDLMILYDKLAKNDNDESCPPIYGFLTVKPNCSRRMMALGESANSGRGLSEVGLYRDSPSLQDEQVDDVNSPDTNFSTGDYDYDDAESESIHRQEELEENRESNRDENENSPVVDTEEQLEQISDDEDQLEHISTHEEEQTEQISGYDEYDKFDNENEEASVDASADVDHEQPVQIPDQGNFPIPSLYCSRSSCKGINTCLCDNCYEVELHYLVTPTPAEVWPAPNKIMSSYHHNPRLVTWMTNHTMTEDDATSELLAVESQTVSEHAQQPDLDTIETKQEKSLAPKTPPMNTTADAPTSENTSVTATLDGDNYDEGHDEIDYNSDEGEGEIDAAIEEIEDGDNEVDKVNVQKQLATPELSAPIDDEITWESEDDEDKKETEGGSPKDMVQVSSLSTTRSPIKRSHEESGALDGTDDKNDYKRRRP